MKPSYLFLITLILIPSVFALTFTDTTFQTSVSNFTIFVDSITLDNVTVTNLTIEFINLTSVDSNFTNTNDTFDATANFIGLDVGLTIRNINTSTDLFTSTITDQDFNATFTSGQTIRTIIVIPETCIGDVTDILTGPTITFMIIFFIFFILIGRFFKQADKNIIKLIRIVMIIFLTIFILHILGKGLLISNIC